MLHVGAVGASGRQRSLLGAVEAVLNRPSFSMSPFVSGVNKPLKLMAIPHRKLRLHIFKHCVFGVPRLDSCFRLLQTF